MRLSSSILIMFLLKFGQWRLRILFRRVTWYLGVLTEKNKNKKLKNFSEILIYLHSCFKNNVFEAYIAMSMSVLKLLLFSHYVRNPSVILSPTLVRNEKKVKHYIRIKTHKPIALRCWVESGVSVLCDWAQVSLVLYLPSETPSLILTHYYNLYIILVVGRIYNL